MGAKHSPPSRIFRCAIMARCWWDNYANHDVLEPDFVVRGVRMNDKEDACALFVIKKKRSRVRIRGSFGLFSDDFMFCLKTFAKFRATSLKILRRRH